MADTIILTVYHVVCDATDNATDTLGDAARGTPEWVAFAVRDAYLQFDRAGVRGADLDAAMELVRRMVAEDAASFGGAL